MNKSVEQDNVSSNLYDTECDVLVVLSNKEDSTSLMYWSYYLTRKIPLL